MSRSPFAMVVALVIVTLLVTSVVIGVAAQAPATVWDGVYTTAQARRGEALYRMRCGECHGDTLAGAEAAPALVGVAFSSTWEGVPLGDLFERTRATMPQNKPGSLSRAQNTDVLAYILEYAKFPAGTTPLDPETLDGILFRTYRP